MSNQKNKAMKKDSIREYERMLARSLRNIQDYEDYTEDYDYLDDYENVAGRRQAGRMLPKFAQTQYKSAEQVGITRIPANPVASEFVGQWDFRIRYAGDSGRPLNEILPVPLFMPLHIPANFAGIDMPSGVTVGVNDYLGANLFYSSTGNEITILIEGITSSYPVLNTGLLSGEDFQISKIRINAPTASGVFLNTGMKVFERTSLGKIIANDSIPFLSQRSPMQFDSTILDLDVQIAITKQRGLIYLMPRYEDVGTASVTFSLFISKIIRK